MGREEDPLAFLLRGRFSFFPTHVICLIELSFQPPEFEDSALINKELFTGRERLCILYK